MTHSEPLPIVWCEDRPTTFSPFLNSCIAARRGPPSSAKAMNCEVLETLYVRHNGDVPCNDDAGERILLGSIPAGDAPWSPAELFTNRHYVQVSQALACGEMPWPDVCRGCAFFRPDERFADSLARRTIRKLQLEPSLACRLRCPSCSNQAQVRMRSGPLLMPPDRFRRVLRGLQNEGFSVGEIEYCGQGEPLQHPNFPEFVRIARTHFPTTCQRVITSGNFDFQTATGGEALDEVFVSCDGVFPESYVRYRKGGNVDLPLQFMRDARACTGPRRPSVIWKYILFEWNDTSEELFAAQRIAREIGVHILLFVFTHSKGKSRRYTLENLDAFPVRGPNVRTNATPIHYQHSDSPAARSQRQGELPRIV